MTSWPATPPPWASWAAPRRRRPRPMPPPPPRNRPSDVTPAARHLPLRGPPGAARSGGPLGPGLLPRRPLAPFLFISKKKGREMSRFDRISRIIFVVIVDVVLILSIVHSSLVLGQ